MHEGEEEPTHNPHAPSPVYNSVYSELQHRRHYGSEQRRSDSSVEVTAVHHFFEYSYHNTRQLDLKYFRTKL